MRRLKTKWKFRGSDLEEDMEMQRGEKLLIGYLKHAISRLQTDISYPPLPWGIENLCLPYSIL